LRPLLMSNVRPPETQAPYQPNMQKRQMNKRGVLLAAFALLAGCATKYDRLRNYTGQDFGTVVVSLGQTRENTMNYSNVWFKAKGGEDLGYFAYAPKYLPSPSPKDFSTSRGKGTLLVKKLPPGEYEITDYSTGSDYGNSVVTYRSRTPMSVPFTVKTGEVSYLGQYLVGIRKELGAELEVSDESQRDLKGSKTIPPMQRPALSFVPATNAGLPAEVRIVR
jgi:hypothetical protein